MTWIDVAWTAMASSSLMLGLIHLLVWYKQRSQYAYLLFFVLATTVAGFAVIEVLLMRAQTVAVYATLMRWIQVPIFVIALSLLGFVRLYFDAGRLWLAYAAAGFRLLALLLNFATDAASVNFREITELAHVTLWGGAVVSTAIGIPNPWGIVAQVSNVLLVAFVADATATLWRRGGALARRRALLVGGALVTCILLASVFAALIVLGSVRAPTILTPSFFVVVLAMGYDLGWEVVHAAQLSRELRDSEERTELAVQAAELAFWSWDMARGEIWTTAKGRALFEFDEGERVDADRFLLRVHPGDRESVRDAMSDVARGGGILEHEFRLALPSGTARRIAARGRTESGSDSMPTLLRGVALDVTERRRLEGETEQQRNELAHLSRVATLGELSGSLAHEINQPLMGILSNAQAAQRFMAGDNANLDEVREILADIVEDDKRAGEVIQRLRTLLKKGEVQHQAFDINRVVDDVLRLMRNDLMNRDVAATAELTPDLSTVLGDRIQVQQVLLNLIVNACDAMDGTPGTRRVFIHTRHAKSGGVEVSVSDQGKGVPPHDLERVFEPFVTTKEHGMGLGLSVCRTIVTAHGGRLWAENNAERGATFRFTLPPAGHAG